MQHGHNPMPPCPHGERQDRTTILGEPICALCRNARRRYADRVDYQSIRAGDDLWDDDTTTDPLRPATERDTNNNDAPANDGPALAGLFTHESGRRIEAIARRHRRTQRDLVLF